MASSSSSPPSSKAKGKAKASTATASTTASAASRPPPSPAKVGFVRRVLPFLLAANIAVGVYVLVRASPKKSEEEEESEKEVPAALVTTSETTIPEKKVVEPVRPPVKILTPIPEQEQRQIFQWILEEKRKVKLADRAEKKKIDEEKALLKEFIRAKSMPSL